jgi:Flp pilus assembly protein TadD
MIRTAKLGFTLSLLLIGASPVFADNKGVADDGESNFSAGSAHLRDGRTDMAVTEFRAAIKKNDKNPYFYKGLGVALAQKNDLKGALEAFRKALELNPYYVDVRNDIGSVLMLMGQREEGKKEFLSAFNDPTNSNANVAARNMGNAFFEDKKYDEAVSWYKTSVQRNPGYPDAYEGLVDSLLALNRADEAVLAVQGGLKEMPDNPTLTLCLGRSYLGAGRFKEARAALEEATKKDPVGTAGRKAAEVLKTVPK